MPVDDLYERLGLPEDEDIDSNTVNGLVQEKTCHLPKVGDRFTLGEYDGVVHPHGQAPRDRGAPDPGESRNRRRTKTKRATTAA